jgi:hypothetical protein
MKSKAVNWIGMALVAAGSLVACGGGGDDAGGAPLAPLLRVDPDTIAFQFSGTNCLPTVNASGIPFPNVTKVLINGGAGDYKVTSTSSELVVSEPFADHNGQWQFTVNKQAGSTTGFHYVTAASS